MTWKRWRSLDRDTKMGNTPIRCRKNVLHQSKAEARHCDVLHALEQAGEISSLIAHPQPSYPLDVNGIHICTYRGDFEFLDRDGQVKTQDVKGYKTETYKLKARLFQAIYGREIEEVRAR